MKKNKSPRKIVIRRIANTDLEHVEGGTIIDSQNPIIFSQSGVS